jgi:hypothetical protein
MFPFVEAGKKNGSPSCLADLFAFDHRASQGRADKQPFFQLSAVCHPLRGGCRAKP